jgi:quercetin dioxygenase-like cupin family protein
VAAGTKLTAANVHFAFPPEPGQWLANDWSKHFEFVTKEAIEAGGAVTRTNTSVIDLHARIRDIAQRVKALFARSSLPVPGGVELEISHHHGLDRFDGVGMTILTVVNREYCKKLLAMLPGQHHPEQYHQQKEETFHLLFGELTLVLDGVAQPLKPGDVVTIQRGVRHAMHTASGAIVEEISSTHFKDDSFYTDESIMANPHRKTFLKYWMD